MTAGAAARLSRLRMKEPPATKVLAETVPTCMTCDVACCTVDRTASTQPELREVS